MEIFPLVKVIHILSATLLFGTGLGTAFFMFRSRFAPDLGAKYALARTTVLADSVFTAPAAIIQPITGAIMISMAGHSAFDLWLVVTYGLYILAGLCWLPVVWIQIQLRDMLRTAIETGTDLPNRSDRLFRIWFLLGWPAFVGLIVVFYLMVEKPSW